MDLELLARRVILLTQHLNATNVEILAESFERASQNIKMSQSFTVWFAADKFRFLLFAKRDLSHVTLLH